MKEFYPTTVMETGYDILFFWVARMIMLGLEFTGKPPFNTVYLHGLIRDEHGRKMSKSLGNVIDPLDIMDKFGTDAVRFTLLTGSTPGNDMNLDVKRIEANRNFANKIWNAARFVTSNIQGAVWKAGGPCWRMPQEGELTNGNDLAQRWIMSRLNHTIADATRLMEDYQFGEAGRLIYEFIWNEYCDWYIEMSKLALNSHDLEAQAGAQCTLIYVLDQAMRLLHPFMPFVTEEVWQHLRQAALGDRPTHQQQSDWPDSLIIAPWPQAARTDEAAERQMLLMMEAIRAVRNARAEFNVKPEKKMASMIVAGDNAHLFESHRAEMAMLARLNERDLVVLDKIETPPKKALSLVLGAVTVYLPFAQMVDLEAERARLTQELAEVRDQIERSEKLLGSDFGRKAPALVVQKERDKLTDLVQKQAKLHEQLRTLE
jgi:valyl-tRNA synthetase